MRSKFLIAIVLLLTTLFSCGVILDSLKIKGVWHLESVTFYKYNEIYDSYKSFDGRNDLTPDMYNPIMGNFFGVKMTDITLTLNDNNSFTIKGKKSDGQSYEVFDSAKSGDWKIDEYNNSLVLECPNYDSTADLTDDTFWKKGYTITNSWVMSSNSKFDLYVKASDFGMDHFTFKLSEHKVPKKIRKNKFESELLMLFKVNGTEWNLFKNNYTLNEDDSYYILNSNTTTENMSKIYKALTEKNYNFELIDDYFYSMEAFFVKDGYQK